MSEEDYGSFDDDDVEETIALLNVTPKPLRQKTLFGGVAPVPTSQHGASYSVPRDRRRNRDEPSTHHRLNTEALKTWVFPTNYAQRDYQFNIIRKALFTNVLVALPTGLGKTFIAAVVMYNWYRWAPESKIIFLAPAKPLVTQQVDACYHVCGIPAAQTAELTGGIDKARRTAAYEERRVFFLTPQTFQNDLQNGLIKARDISCLVIDEAHHATGNYAYVNVVRQMRAETDSFRILALTATPGKSVETVQEVIDRLNISQIEIRSESSIDICSYTHTKEIETILLDLSPELVSVQTKYAGLLKPMMQKLISFGVGMTSDPTKLSAFAIREAVNKLQRESHAGRGGNANAARSVGGILSSLAFSMELLNTHGIRPFYDAMVELKASVKSSANKKGIVQNANFGLMMLEMEDMMRDPQYTGHPKLDHLTGLIINHFQLAEEQGQSETRVMIFSSLRVSAETIVTVLKQHSPLVKPTPFFGQQASKSGSGMSQKEQQETISKFKQGTFNVLVATSVGEEGLDIGEVDMIICYDSSSSPARMLQRMGRTGRKRDGQVFVLCMRGKEEMAYIKAKDAYKVMQKKIEKGIDIKLSETVHRIIPWNVNPECEKRLLQVPEGDQTSDRQLISAARKKKQAKLFHMPDGVQTGFVSAASTLAGTKRKRAKPQKTRLDDQLWDFDAMDSTVSLTRSQEEELGRRFRKIDEGHEGCLRLKREEEGRFLDRSEIRATTRTALLCHGRTMKTIHDLLHTRFLKPALVRATAQFRETVDHGISQDSVLDHVVEEAEETRLPIRKPAGSSANSYAELGSFVNDESVDLSIDHISESSSSASVADLESLDNDRAADCDTQTIHVTSSESDTDADLDVPVTVRKKLRLSQLERSSDEDELPDTRRALEQAIVESTRVSRQRQHQASPIQEDARTVKRSLTRSKIRIADEEDEW